MPTQQWQIVMPSNLTFYEGFWNICTAMSAWLGINHILTQDAEAWGINIYFTFVNWLKGCGMGPWLVLVSPCFRENVVATCKIGSFLRSLDNLHQKNVIVLFFGNQISKWHSFEKKGLFLTYFSHFLVIREKF